MRVSNHFPVVCLGNPQIGGESVVTRNFENHKKLAASKPKQRYANCAKNYLNIK